MSKFSKRYSLLLRTLAVSNLLFLPVLIWITLSYPLEIVDSLGENSLFWFFLVVLLVDLILTVSTFAYTRQEFRNASRLSLLLISYVIVGGLARLLVAGVGSGAVLDTTQIISPFFAAMSSVLFISILFTLRNSKIGSRVITELNFLMLINILAAFFLSGLPTVVMLVTVDFPVAQLLYGPGAILKTISYLVAALTYHRWAIRMNEYDLAVTEDLSWPERMG